MSNKVSYVTKEGLKKLQEELERLQNVERPKISKAIGEAIEKGDISENAEYDAAKDAQGLLEAKIAQLKDTIATWFLKLKQISRKGSYLSIHRLHRLWSERN